MPAVIILYVLFASIFTVAKYGLDFVRPFFLVGVRMCIAGTLLLLFARFVQKAPWPRGASLWWRLLLLGLFNIYMTNAFEFWGLQYLTSFKTCFIYSLSPFLSALCSYIAFSEKMTRRKWLGFGIGCVGFLPILLSQPSSEVEMTSVAFLSLAELAVMAAAASTVIGWILMRDLVRHRACSPVMANGISMLFGGVMALAHSRISEPWQPFPVDDWEVFVYVTVVMIVISNFVCYNLYGYLLKRFTATFLSFAGFMTPVFAALYGTAFLSESIDWGFICSVGVVLLGLYFFYQEELAQEGIHLPTAEEREGLEEGT